MNLNDLAKEMQLLSIWEKYTLIKPDKKIDFFESGGDSLSAINVIVEIQKNYNVDISLENFMRNPTLDFLFNQIHQMAG